MMLFTLIPLSCIRVHSRRAPYLYFILPLHRISIVWIPALEQFSITLRCERSLSFKMGDMFSGQKQASKQCVPELDLWHLSTDAPLYLMFSMTFLRRLQDKLSVQASSPVQSSPVQLSPLNTLQCIGENQRTS